MEIPAIKDIQSRPTIPDSSEKHPKKPSPLKEPEGSSMEFVEKISEEQEKRVQELTENLNQFMRNIDYNLQFVPDREAGVVIIKVLDANGKVIRQIPPEAILSLSSRIGESMGVLINSKL